MSKSVRIQDDPDVNDNNHQPSPPKKSIHFEEPPENGLLQLPLDFKIPDPKELKRQRLRILKNIGALSIGFVFLFAATTGLSLLQSSLNAEVGVIGLCVNFAAVVVSCLFLSTTLIQKIGCKWSIVISMVALCVWMAANLYPVWETIIPASVIMGTGWAPLWTAQCTYFTVNGIEYSKLTDEMPDAVISKFFGIFFMLFMTAPVFGNVISSSILSQKSVPISSNDSVPMPPVSDELYALCGASDCPGVVLSENATNDNYVKPENNLIYMLVGIYLGLGALALLTVVFLVDRIKPDEEDKEKTKFSLQLLVTTLKQLRNRYQVFMVPLTIYTGMEQAFMTAEFTRAYTTCALGVDKVGYVVICYGVVAAIVSVVSGQLVKKTGRIPVFIVGAVTHLASLVVLLYWNPHPNLLYLFFVMPAVWGIGDAIWQTQINALYGILFSDNSEAAFSNYRMWESIGFIIGLAYSSFICVYIKIYVLIVVLIIGIFGYLVVEFFYRQERKQKADEDDLDSEEEERGDALFGLADVIRRKSSLFVPEKSLQDAVEVIRRKSSVMFLDGDVNYAVRRRLSSFAPIAAIKDMTPSSTPDGSPAAARRRYKQKSPSGSPAIKRKFKRKGTGLPDEILTENIELEMKETDENPPAPVVDKHSSDTDKPTDPPVPPGESPGAVPVEKHFDTSKNTSDATML